MLFRSEQGGRYWRDLARKRHDFSSHAHLAAAVREITLEGWREHLQTAFLDAPRSVLLYTAGRFASAEETEALSEGRQHIDSYEAFKADLPWYQMP